MSGDPGATVVMSDRRARAARPGRPAAATEQRRVGRAPSSAASLSRPLWPSPSLATAAELAASLAELYANPPQEPSGFDPVVRGGLMSQLIEREAELADFEACLTGLSRTRTAASLGDLPELLIAARQGRGWTQGELAGRIGMAEDRIIHAEATRYAEAPLALLVRASEVLGVVVQVSVAVPPLPSAGAAGQGDRGLPAQP